MKPRRSDPSAAGSKVVTMRKTKTPHAANDTNPTTGPNLVRVPFHDHAILAAEVDGDHWLPLRPLCERFGLAMQPQHRKLQGAEWACVTEMVMQIPGDDQTRRVTCISLGSLGAWLLSIKAGKVKPEVRAALVAYQKEAAAVLYRHFFGGGVAASPGLSAEDVANIAAQVVTKGILPLVEAHRKMAEDVAQLRSELVALHRDHNNARDMAAIGGQCASERIRKPILRMAKEKARYLGGKAAEASFNRKFHLRVREACDGFSGSWDRLPRGLLGRAETCVANILREVRADTILAERHGYTPVQMKLDEGRDRRPN